MANSNENNFSFIHVLFFLSAQNCCFRNSDFNNALLYQNEERGNTVTRTSTYLSFKFIVETIRHHYYCMLVKSFLLINKCVISPYVQEQGGILLKFNIFRLHDVLWENNPETLKNCFLWFNQVAVFTVISWNHYAEIFMNFGTKRL